MVVELQKLSASGERECYATHIPVVAVEDKGEICRMVSTRENSKFPTPSVISCRVSVIQHNTEVLVMVEKR